MKRLRVVLQFATHLGNPACREAMLSRRPLGRLNKAPITRD